jgi:hypothetical protein
MADLSFIVTPKQPLAYYSEKLKLLKAYKPNCAVNARGCPICEASKAALITELVELIKDFSQPQ